MDNHTIKEQAFLFDNYAITADTKQFILHVRKIVSDTKKKENIGKERWETVGYYPTVSSVFNKLSNLLCVQHIGNLSLAVEKINKLQKMIKTLTTIRDE